MAQLGGRDEAVAVLVEDLEGLQDLLLRVGVLHAFADVPVHEGALGAHKIELVAQAGEDFRDGHQSTNWMVACEPATPPNFLISC